MSKRLSIYPAENEKRPLYSQLPSTDDSDDEKISVPPKLSYFGSALVSDKEDDPLGILSRKKSRTSSLATETYANNHTAGHTYVSTHSGEPSQSTLFAQYKNNQQPSMTTMNSTQMEEKHSNDFDSSFRKIKSMQQSMREELTSRHAERRSRRFLSSARIGVLGPAKRASSYNEGSSAASVLSDDSNREELPEARTPLSRIEFGDLNPVQYLKKHNLPSSDLPRISRLYFEKQKNENWQSSRLKHIFPKENVSTGSSKHSPLFSKKENSPATLQPRRKLSDTSLVSGSKNTFYKALSSPVVPSQKNVFLDKTNSFSSRNSEYANTNHSNTFIQSHKKREALANIDINRNNDQSYLQEAKRFKSLKSCDPQDATEKTYKRQASLATTHQVESPPPVPPQNEEFYHREPPKPPVVKRVEIVEPKTRMDSGKGLQTKRNITVVNDVEYEKIELLGRGGSSKVYKVKDNFNKIYALKRVVFDEFDDSSVSGFKGEIELLNKLKDQARVVKLLDYEMEPGVLNLIMECGDHDLSQILNQRAGMPLDIEFVRYHAREMLRCVKVVHDAGIVHSDLKPANFVFVKGILKIIDFGIANAVPDHTVNIYRETQIGTPNYMAPEALVAMNYTQDDGRYQQQNRWKVGKPSDVWSCGCIIYQMIYGRPPYGGFQGQNRLLAIMNPEVKVIFSEKTANDDTVPRSVLDTMKACLLRNPQKRWTVDEILESPFLKPVMVTPFFIRDLIKNAVRYGADQKEVSKDKVEELADDVLNRLADIRL
ncbi:MPS1 (YDL028C) [Zygosaccharomyces parabailii]|nr:MPS1 (YDL028C) [Zygosaccharomyces parabailii]